MINYKYISKKLRDNSVGDWCEISVLALLVVVFSFCLLLVKAYKMADDVDVVTIAGITIHSGLWRECVNFVWVILLALGGAMYLFKDYIVMLYSYVYMGDIKELEPVMGIIDNKEFNALLDYEEFVATTLGVETYLKEDKRPYKLIILLVAVSKTVLNLVYCVKLYMNVYLSDRGVTICLLVLVALQVWFLTLLVYLIYKIIWFKFRK